MSAVLFGSAGLFVKLLYLNRIDAVTLLIMQYVIASILMFLMLFIFNRKLLIVTKQQLFRLAIIGILGNSFMTVFYYSAYKYLPMPIVTMLLYTYPIIIYFYSIVFKKQAIKMNQLIALILAFIGCILSLDLIYGQVKFSIKGIGFGILAAIFFAFMNLYSEEKLEEINPLAINAYSTLFSLLSLVIFNLPNKSANYNLSLRNFIFTLILALFCEIIPLTLLYSAIKHIGSIKVSIIGNLEIPTAIVLSSLILKSSMTATEMLGVTIVIFSVYVLQKG
jgi:Predicted permease, DMT superfamily